MSFGGPIQQFGWLFLGVGMIFVWAFAARADLSGVLFTTMDTGTATGHVLETEELNLSIDDRSVWAARFEYAVDGVSRRGLAYAHHGHPGRGQDVSVEYLVDHPNIARIEGMRRAALPPLGLLAGLFAVVGLAIVVPTHRRRRRSARLLRIGEFTRGRLVAKEKTGTEINGQPVWALTFAFSDLRGTEHTLQTRTADPSVLEDEPDEAVLYDPSMPAVATTLNDMPGHVHLDDAGHLQLRDRRLVRTLLVPGLTLVGHGGYLLYRLSS